jgi:hypothetical protein
MAFAADASHIATMTQKSDIEDYQPAQGRWGTLNRLDRNNETEEIVPINKQSIIVGRCVGGGGGGGGAGGRGGRGGGGAGGGGRGGVAPPPPPPPAQPHSNIR